MDVRAPLRGGFYFILKRRFESRKFGLHTDTLIRTYYRKEVMERKESPRKILIIDDDEDCRKLLLN